MTINQRDIDRLIADADGTRVTIGGTHTVRVGVDRAAFVPIGGAEGVAMVVSIIDGDERHREGVATVCAYHADGEVCTECEWDGGDTADPYAENNHQRAAEQGVAMLVAAHLQRQLRRVLTDAEAPASVGEASVTIAAGSTPLPWAAG